MAVQVVFVRFPLLPPRNLGKIPNAVRWAGRRQASVKINRDRARRRAELCRASCVFRDEGKRWEEDLTHSWNRIAHGALLICSPVSSHKTQTVLRPGPLVAKDTSGSHRVYKTSEHATSPTPETPADIHTVPITAPTRPLHLDLRPATTPENAHETGGRDILCHDNCA